MKRNEWKIRLDDALSGIGENPWLYQQVLHRAKEEEAIVKKKISIFVIAAAMLVIVTVGAAATAVSGWNVLDFLFSGRTRETPPVAFTDISQEAAADGASLRVNSAVYDGRMLAFDYTLENKKPESPVYCRVEDFTANGARIWTDGTDDVHEQWLPGVFSDGVWQDGELILLPEAVRGAEQLHIVLTVTLYRPTRPVYWMEEFDPEEARQKAEEGYYVIAEGEGFVGYDAEEGQWTRWFMGPLPEDMGDYETERLTVSFVVVKPDQGFQNLQTQKIYENDRCTAQYKLAEITPLGLYLTLRLSPKDEIPWKGAVSVNLTDGRGSSLMIGQDWEKFLPTIGETLSTVDQSSQLARYCWAGITADDLPDTISLTWILPDGEKLIFPVQVRASSEEKTELTPSQAVGVWYLQARIQDGVEYIMKRAYRLEINRDKTAMIIIGDIQIPFTWEISDVSVVLRDGGGESFVLHWLDGQFILRNAWDWAEDNGIAYDFIFGRHAVSVFRPAWQHTAQAEEDFYGEYELYLIDDLTARTFRPVDEGTCHVTVSFAEARITLGDQTAVVVTDFQQYRLLADASALDSAYSDLSAEISLDEGVMEVVVTQENEDGTDRYLYLFFQRIPEEAADS